MLRSLSEFGTTKIERSAILGSGHVTLHNLSRGTSVNITDSLAFLPTKTAITRKGGHVTCYPSAYSFALPSEGYYNIPTAVSSFCDILASSAFKKSIPPTATTDMYDPSGVKLQGSLFIGVTVADNCTTASFNYDTCTSGLLDIFDSCQRNSRSYFVGGVAPYSVGAIACGDFMLAGLSAVNGEDPSQSVTSANNKLESPARSDTVAPAKSYYVESTKGGDATNGMARHSTDYKIPGPLHRSYPAVTTTMLSHAGTFMSKGVQSDFSGSGTHVWSSHRHNHHTLSPSYGPHLYTGTPCAFRETIGEHLQTTLTVPTVFANSIHVSRGQARRENLNGPHLEAMALNDFSKIVSMTKNVGRIHKLEEKYAEACSVVPVYGAQEIIYSTQCAGVPASTVGGGSCVPCEGCEANQCIPK